MKKILTFLTCSIIIIACGKTEQSNTGVSKNDENNVETLASLTPYANFFTTVEFLSTYNVKAMEKKMTEYWELSDEACVFPFNESESSWYYCRKEKDYTERFKKGDKLFFYPFYSGNSDFTIEENNRFSFRQLSEEMRSLQYSISMDICKITHELTDEYPISRLNGQEMVTYSCGEKTFSIIKAHSNGKKVIDEYNDNELTIDNKYVFLWSADYYGEPFEACTLFEVYDNQYLFVDLETRSGNVIENAKFDEHGNLLNDCSLEYDEHGFNICYLILKDVFVINGEYYERIK